MSRNRPLVYVSNSYQAPAGLKGLVIEALAKYKCDVVVWGEKGSEAGNLAHINTTVDVMIIIPPATTYHDFYCTVGSGQKAELAAFYRGNHSHGELATGKHVLVLNLNATEFPNGKDGADDTLFVDECTNGWEDVEDGNTKNKSAKLFHDGDEAYLHAFLDEKREIHSGLHYDHDYEAGKQVAIAHLALYGQLN